MKFKPIVHILFRQKILVLIILLATFLGFLIVGNHNVQLKDELFCDTDTDLYQTILSKVFEWDTYFPDEFPQYSDKDLFIFFQTPDNSNYVVHAVYWTTEGNSPIFYVPLATHLRRNLEVGKYGIFYTPTGELPTWGISEYYPLSDRIYCYQGK